MNLKFQTATPIVTWTGSRSGLLQAGMPMERVSVLLGHSSIKVTERYYSPRTRARLEQ